MKIKTLQDINLQDKVVLYRAPYDIGVETVNGRLEVKDDLRIRATLPTLEYLLGQNCKIVILTYVQRPDGQVVEELRTTPHARKLAELLGCPVAKVDDCIGPEVEAKILQMRAGDILMLENVRFYKEETEDDDEFARQLCAGKDIIVFDGFPQALRIHASTTGILRHLPAVAGFYLAGEVKMLGKILDNPKRPFSALIGGSKVSDKVAAVGNLLKIADRVMVGGAVAHVFLKAQGHGLGDSFVEDVFVDKKRREKKDWVAYAKEILEKYKEKIIFPKDSVISNGSEIKILDITKDDCPTGWSVLDIGPETRREFSEIIEKSGTVFLGGPMGKFEEKDFAAGTQAILAAMQNLTKNLSGETIIAGGDTIDAVRRFSGLENYSHVSLAGGATLDFLAGKELPALRPLMES